jgi:hypothetical protein
MRSNVDSLRWLEARCTEKTLRFHNVVRQNAAGPLVKSFRLPLQPVRLIARFDRAKARLKGDPHFGPADLPALDLIVPSNGVEVLHFLVGEAQIVLDGGLGKLRGPGGGHGPPDLRDGQEERLPRGAIAICRLCAERRDRDQKNEHGSERQHRTCSTPTPHQLAPPLSGCRRGLRRTRPAFSDARASGARPRVV